MTTRDAAPEVEPAELGERARVIRRRRGLSRDTVAALAHLTAEHLSGLESGERWFDRRGLIEDVANALECTVPTLTGQPYLPVDRASAQALAVLPGLRMAILGTSLDEPPPVRPGTLAGLLQQVEQVHQHADQDRYDHAGQSLELLLGALQVHAATDTDARPTALAEVVQVCQLGALIADTLGYQDLALATAARAVQAALRCAAPAMLGLARLRLARTWTHAGARDHARALNDLAITELDAAADTTTPDDDATIMLGLHHLLAAELAARSGNSTDAHDHLHHAHTLAERTGEQVSAHQRFGPTLVRLHTLTVAADLGEGPDAYAQAPDPDRIATLDSRTLTGHYHLACARVLAQDETGNHDDDATRHLNHADRAAPVLLRNNPVARELLAGLTNRARRYAHQVDRLTRRFGIA